MNVHVTGTVADRPVIHTVVGDRWLVRFRNATSYKKHDAMEVTFLEASPSGKWIKLRNLHGQTFWKIVDDVDVVEVLKKIEKAPPPKETMPE